MTCYSTIYVTHMYMHILLMCLTAYFLTINGPSFDFNPNCDGCVIKDSLCFFCLKAF